jgi:hypothetical protein
VLARLALHSFSLDFDFAGESLHLKAAIPKDLRALLHQLQKNK